MSTNNKVRIALLGAGRIGGIRAELIAENPRAELVFIVDSNLDVAGKMAARFGAKAVATLEEALPHIDAVWISTPTDLHPAQIKQAAAAGKAVATEKPVAFTQEEISACFDACAAASVPFHVGFNRRSDPHFFKFKEALAKNAPAHIIRIVNRDHPLPSREQFAHLGSIWSDFLIHDFDTAVWLLEDEPVSIYASGTQMMEECKGTDTLDTALVNIKFKSGTQVSIEASRYSAGGLDQRLEAVTRNATIFANNPLRSEVVIVDANHTSNDIFNFSFPQRYRSAYGNEIEHFVRMILDGATQKVTKEQALLVGKIVDLADASHRQQKVLTF